MLFHHLFLGVLFLIVDLVLVASFIYVNHLRRSRSGIKVHSLGMSYVRWGAVLGVITLILLIPSANARRNYGAKQRYFSALHLRELASQMSQYESKYPGFILEANEKPVAGERGKKLDAFWFTRRGIPLSAGSPYPSEPTLIVRLLPDQPLEKADPCLISFGKRWFLVYSTGRNRKDEGGQGDDMPIGEAMRE